MPRRLPLLLLFSAAAACASLPERRPPEPPVADCLEAVADHARRYPQMEAEDVYKIVWQVVCGPSFVPLGTGSGLDELLAHDVATLRPSPFPDPDDEPLFDSLGSGRRWVRLNLRPFLRRGGTVWELGRWVAESARTIRGRREDVGPCLEAVAGAIESGDLPLSVAPEELRALGRRRAAEGFPPARHSRRYAETYAPAYRVVLLELLDPALLEPP